MRRLFFFILKGYKVMFYIVMNIVLNMLGVGNGVIVFGLKVMSEF